MNLSTIEMDPGAARQAFLEYRAAVRADRVDEDRRRREEDEAIMRGYREIAKGVRLLRLSDTMRLGGVRAQAFEEERWRGAGQPRQRVEVEVTLPRLAIARADVPFAYTHGVHVDGGLQLLYTRDWLNARQERSIELQTPSAKGIEFEAGTFEPDDRRAFLQGGRPQIRALVPSIPPRLRPKARLGNFHILWEAEWELDRTVAPGDPVLLRHVGGDLWAIVAQWDLTPLEQAVLAGRRPSSSRLPPFI